LNKEIDDEKHDHINHAVGKILEKVKKVSLQLDVNLE